MCGHDFVQYGLDKSAFSTYSFGKLAFRLPVFSLFSACSVFRFHLHKFYSIYITIVDIGVRRYVMLFALYKEQFVITNIAL